MSVWTIGSKAVGLPGAHSWKDCWALLFRNCSEVVLALDPDSTGEKAARHIARSLHRFGIESRFADLPKGKDVNDLLVDGGARRVKEALGC